MLMPVDMRMGKSIAAIAALVGWAGLLLQLVLIVRNLGPTLGVWRFVGFFTVLTNMLAATVATAIALGRSEGIAGARVRLAAATSMLMVGIVYSIALRNLWHPTGLQKVADVLLHDAAPLLWFLVWLAASLPGSKWREIGWALAWPFAYSIYALGRGALDGWYAYWFLDPSKQTPLQLLASIAIMLAGFALMATFLAAIDPWHSRRRQPEPRQSSLVDEAGRESFPASDPPSWTLGEDR